MQIEEEKEEELPIIKQTRFFLTKKRNYLFDVNQEISIYKLKKMISVAANLGKNIRLFHDNIEYTDKDSYSLEELFPKLQLIEFKIVPQQQQVEEIDDLINLRMKSFCEGHKGKYPNFYCYTCSKSICTECLRDKKHEGHNIKEKYDYLQESKDLIENLFFDLKDLLGKVEKGEGVPEDIIKNLKLKITMQFFPRLVEIVKQIEQNMVSLISFFLEKDQANYKLIQNNLTSLKSSCAEGLDKLKENIEIEDLMVDENIFLTFDTKYKDINNEKEKIKKDIDTYKTFSDNLNLIKDIIEKTYNEIYEFLTKYLEITKFTEIRNKLSDITLSEINKKEVLEKILGNIKQKEVNPKFIEFLKHIRNMSESVQKKEEDIEMKDASTASKSGIKKEIKEENKEEEEAKVIEEAKEKEDKNNKNKDNNKKRETKAISHANIEKKPNDFKNPHSPSRRKLRSGSLKATEKKVKEKMEELEERESEKIQEKEEDNSAPSPLILSRVMSIIPGTDQLLTYNSSKNSNTMKKVEFPPLIGIKQFLKDCSWVNYKNKLYILGGEYKTKKSKLFLEYNSLQNSFKRLPDSKHAHKGHCLIVHENILYCIGGAQDECEKFDFEDNSWSLLPKMAFAQENPVLYVYNNILFSLFGTNENGKFIDNIQKLNLKSNKLKWINANYNRNGCNLKILGCGIIKMDENKIYLLGGKLEKEVSKSMIEFDLLNMRANRNENTLGQNAYFKESMMLKIGEDQFGNYSIYKENNSSLITVTIDKKEK